VDGRDRVGRGEGGGPGDPEVFAGEGERLGGPGAAQDGEELVGAGVAGVVVVVVAEALLLDRVAAGDDVEQEPAAGDALVGGGHLRGQGGGDGAGAERDEEPQPLGLADERGRGDPGVLAERAGRGEHAPEAEALGGAGDLGEVVDVGFAVRGVLGPVSVQALDDGAPVARGGEEPVEDDAHGALRDRRGTAVPQGNREPLSSQVDSTGGGLGFESAERCSARQRVPASGNASARTGGRCGPRRSARSARPSRAGRSSGRGRGRRRSRRRGRRTAPRSAPRTRGRSRAVPPRCGRS